MSSRGTFSESLGDEPIPENCVSRPSMLDTPTVLLVIVVCWLSDSVAFLKPKGVSLWCKAVAWSSVPFVGVCWL